MAQYVPMELPYYAPSADLPAPLPTLHDIKNATEIIQKGFGPTVVGIGPFIVKYGCRERIQEAKTMHFIRHHTTVRVPRVYAAYKDPVTRDNYIVMERIHGQTLLSLWPSLDDARKERICRQIETCLNELRALPSPGGYCAPGNQPLLSSLYREIGPANTEAELNDAMIDSYKSKNSDPKHEWSSIYLRRSFAAVLRGNPPTFCHGDLQTKNIMVSPEDDIVTFIDWEMAGWYPAYWEYVTAGLGAAAVYETDWLEWLERILVPSRNEFAWHMLAYHFQFF
ncbi:hypothetical protein RBB50_011283 [Rhinocladiella similis]